MTRLGALAVALGVLVVAGLGPAHAEKRVALVIGNSGYEFAPNLPNPENDASDMAALLERLGFDVTLAVDQSGQEMRTALRDFARDARGADIATVFYAGHGIEIDKQNFLIPVDARLASDSDVRFETITLDDVLLAVEGASGLQIVILDACRENPFASAMERAGATRSIGRGLARIEPEGSSVVVAYAAREGQVADDGGGRNSPYTAALLDNLATPGMEIGLLFRKVRAAVMASTNRAQQPFVYQSLGEDPVYLVPSAQSDTSGAEARAEPTPNTPSRLDEAERGWAVTQNTTSVAVLEAFIEEFPDSLYARLARARIAELNASRDDEPVVAAIDPSQAEDAPREGRDTQSTDAARLLYEGTLRYGERNFQEAFKLFEQAAEAGAAGAMHNLGVMYRDGQGVARDHGEAVRWFRQAAEAGQVNAMTNLGVMYENGVGVAQDEHEAVRWWQQAAEAGEALAMNNLGSMYARGRGVAQDYNEAVRLYQQAAEAGEFNAFYNLSRMYEEGSGVATDRSRAARYVLQAITAGSDLSRDQMTNNATAWSVEFRREFQRLLSEEGVYDGAIDGQFGPGTIAAIEALASR